MVFHNKFTRKKRTHVHRLGHLLEFSGAPPEANSGPEKRKE